MKFDDRLATILSLTPNGPHDRAVRWRQLVDLVARAGPEASGPTVAQAIAQIREGRDDVAVEARAAAARSIAGRALPDALLEAFAADRLDVAAPLLANGPPTASLRRAASPAVRRFLDAMHPPQLVADPIAGPEAAPMPESAAEPTAPVPAAIPSISEVVERIERLRVARDAGLADRSSAPVPSAPPAPPIPVPPVERPVPTRTAPPRHDPPTAPESLGLFRWECGPGGNIGWVEGAPRGALVGRSIARAEPSEGVDRDVERAFARRAPFRDANLSLPEAGLVAGDWLISGVPAFAPGDGRFVGYRGIARRAEALKAPVIAAVPGPLDPAALRELVHEIKTPLNAIIGFAEIIDGQYLGPAQSGYRERAAEIVAQAGILLSAIDDLDFAARLRGRDSAESSPSDFMSFFQPFAYRLQKLALDRGVTLAIDSPPGEGLCTLDRELAERLLDRFAEAVFAATTPGETLRLAVRREDGFCALRLSRPRALEGMSDSDLFGGRNGDGADFSLRMVVGLAQIVGGKLAADGGDLVLRMPMAA
ncbi:MAG: histidine kinase dimerization/phospho-acceptor domain-containing protein [Sphingomicrobium sp.]